MQGNADNCHVLISTEQKVHANIGKTQIENSNVGKRLKYILIVNLILRSMWES